MVFSSGSESVLLTKRFVRSFCFCLMSSDAKSILGTIKRPIGWGFQAAFHGHSELTGALLRPGSDLP